MTTSYLNTRIREHTTAKRAPRKPKGFVHLTCKACDFQKSGLTMDSKYYHRSTSPGSRKLVIPGRSSTGTFGGTSSAHDSNYSSYARSARDEQYLSPTAPRKSQGVIPVSTEVVYKNKNGSTSSSSGSRDHYSGRSRRESDIGGARAPAIIQSSTLARPSSPLSRSFDPRETYVKPATTTSSSTRREHKMKMYTVGDNGSARLIAETEPHRSSQDYSRRERPGYPVTGSSRRPREIEDSEWSYTDAAGMFNETEPIRRPRRGSVDRGSTRRPTSVIDPYTQPRNSRDFGPPPSTRGFNKINDLGRTSSVREPVRSSSRDRAGSYDVPPYDLPLRAASTMPVVVNQQPPRNSRDDAYYRDDYRNDYDEPRQPRRRTKQFTDDAVETRGFGVRTGSADRYGSSNSSGTEGPPPPPRTRRIEYPLPAQVPATGMYGSEPLTKMPSQSEYIAPPIVDDRKGSVDRRERDREWDRPRDRELDRPRDRELDRPRDRELDKTKDRELDRPKDRDYDRPREREREYDRGYDRENHKRSHRDELRDVAAPAAATGAGVAAIAATGAAIDNRHREKRQDSSDEERSRRSRHDPNSREDERERRYAEKDRDERKKDRRDKEPELDADEDWRRRVQQQQLELSKQRPRDDDRPDSERDRTERDRRWQRDQLNREPERHEDRDRRESRKDSVDDGPGPLDTRPRERDIQLETEASQQHNRLDSRHNSIFEDNLVQEPEPMSATYPRDPQATTGAAMPPPPAPPGIVATLPTPEIAPRASSADNKDKEKERRVTIVEPPKNEPIPEPPIRGILRKPTQKFPEDPNPIREGVTPLKKSKDIPSDAKWTKIDRRLVNPQALREKEERFEERQDCVIVLRVLTKDEIQGFADRTREIRGEREDSLKRDSKRPTSQRHRNHDDDSEDSEREHRHRHEGEGQSRRRSRKDDDTDYSTEEESARRVIEEGRRSRSKREEEEYTMAGGLGR